MNVPLDSEWLEADGLGGFASGTVSGIRTRRYHALLLSATTPPAGRMALVSGFDAWVETSQGTFALSSQRYTPDVVHPDGVERLESFSHEPWPRWTWRITDELRIEQELFAVHGKAAVFVSWKLIGEPRGALTLKARPFLSIRDFHSMQRENGAFHFQANETWEHVFWHPYDGVPGVAARSNGTYRHEPAWYRNFLYGEEAARGLDATEDLASPGIFHWDLASRPAVWLFTPDNQQLGHPESTQELYAMTRRDELARRQAFPSALHKAADAYFVKRGNGKTIIAGYPWFGDWGRDTFIALRGLCLATGRLDDARSILTEWAGAVSEGMLPNRFPDRGETPEYNSVDASLWYVVAAQEFLEATGNQEADAAVIVPAMEAILEGYSRGTRFHIQRDRDGLLACGVPGVQLTWMDAKVGDWVVTPRIGKPVEIQALWVNALRAGREHNPKWKELFEQALSSFRERFWNPGTNCLFDVVDVNHEPGTKDTSVRPNQIFAVGGLPFPLIENGQARQIVDTVEASLLTPVGLRSLAPSDAAYRPRYEGGVWERDSSYHQGTVWPWLLGAFIGAWLRVRQNRERAVAEARERFLSPLLQHLQEAGLGHISEVADAEPPHTPRGCPFQAWSLGELLRIQAMLSEARSGGF